jgi:hypothetical protein
VSIGRLRTGELLAGAGAVVLFVALFLEWFSVDVHDGFGRSDVAFVLGVAPHMSGWNALGWFVLALAALAVALATWLVVATAAARPVTQVVAAAVPAATAAPIALVALALRALVFQPSANAVVSVEYGAWIGLAGALALAVGSWWALADERTEAPESAYTPPPPRPAPPERAS